jgi:hypothetical protein
MLHEIQRSYNQNKVSLTNLSLLNDMAYRQAQLNYSQRLP